MEMNQETFKVIMVEEPAAGMNLASGQVSIVPGKRGHLHRWPFDEWKRPHIITFNASNAFEMRSGGIESS